MAKKTNTKTNENTEKLVELFIPLTKYETADVFLSVNERTWQIKRGERVMVPLAVKEVWEEHERLEKRAWDYQAAHRIT